VQRDGELDDAEPGADVPPGARTHVDEARADLVGELAQLISPYPSLADAIQKTASLYFQDVAKGWLGSAGKRVAKWSQ